MGPVEQPALSDAVQHLGFLVLLPANILKVAFSSSSSSAAEARAQQMLQAGLGLALGRAACALQAAAGGNEPHQTHPGRAEAAAPM